MVDFQPILNRALQRKGGERGLEVRIAEPLSKAVFASQADHRFLSMMTKVIFQAGFVSPSNMNDKILKQFFLVLIRKR